MSPQPSRPAPSKRPHQRLGIAEEDFEEMLRILEANLIKFEVDPANTAMVLAGYRELQSQVVGRADDG